MTHPRTKLIVGGVLLILAVSYLAFAGVKKGWVYYLDVDAFASDTKYHDQRVRLCGTVAEEGVISLPAQLRAEFPIHGREQTVPVVYQGVVADLFKPGCEVVIEGKLNDAGVFEADVMLTKCASKYSAEDHAKRLEARP